MEDKKVIAYSFQKTFSSLSDGEALAKSLDISLVCLIRIFGPRVLKTCLTYAFRLFTRKVIGIMEPRAILVAKKTFVFLVFVLPATILVIYGIDGLPSTPCIIALAVGLATSCLVAGYAIFLCWKKRNLRGSSSVRYVSS